MDLQRDQNLERRNNYLSKLYIQLFNLIFFNGYKDASKCVHLKFMFSEKATKIDETITTDLTLCGKCQIVGEDFFNFYGLIRKHKLYNSNFITFNDPYFPTSQSEIKGN